MSLEPNMRVTRQCSTGGDNVWLVECVPFKEAAYSLHSTSVPARDSDLDHDMAPAPVIPSGPFATSLVNVPLSRVPGSVGPDLVDSI